MLTHPARLKVAKVHPLLILAREGPCSDAAEDGDLVSRFIDRPIAVERFRHPQSRAITRHPARGDEHGYRPRAEAGTAGGFGTGELDDSQAVAAVGQIGELAGVCDAKLH